MLLSSALLALCSCTLLSLAPETDVKLDPFIANMAASNFTWLSANAQILNYPTLKKNAIVQSKPDANNGRTVKMGIVGLTIDSNNKTGIETYYGFEYSSTIIAPQQVQSLNDQGADFIVALTHYDWSVDMELVERVAGLSIVIGGHDHVVIEKKTPGKATVYKADSVSKQQTIFHQFSITQFEQGSI